MAYEVTATRKRPRSFNELTGQEFVVTTLKKSLESGRIAQAFLFSGPRGVGKTSMARILAKSLNCESGPTAEPCGTCSHCVEIARGASLDVIEIDGASNTSVNDVRNIKDEVLFAPANSKYKVYIIDEVHMLSNSAFNALLKTIEEPPPYVVFIFATTELHKVPATIKSRCQQYNFRLIGTDEIKERLSSAAVDLAIQVDDEALFWMAKEATGSMRDAYTLFDQIAAFSDGQITLEKIREKLGLVGLDQMNQIAEALALGKAREALELTDAILASGVAVEQFVMDLADYYRALLFFLQHIDREALLGFHPDRFPEAVKTQSTVPQAERALETLLALYRTLRYSLSQRYELELALSRMATLRHYVTPAELVARIEALKAGWSAEPEKKKLNPSLAPSPASIAAPAPAVPTKVAPSPILAVIDRMMAAPAPEKPATPVEVRNPHAGAAAATPVLGPKALNVERPSAVKDELDEAAELFRVVFKGEILPNS